MLYYFLETMWEPSGHCDWLEIIDSQMTDREERSSMEDRMPISGGFYRHFKGKIYQVKMIAKDSETEELLVVYQGMYAPFQHWVRTLQEFNSPVDLRKYPQTQQKMRFEPISAKELETATPIAAATGAQCGIDSTTEERDSMESGLNREASGMDDAALVRALTSGNPERYLSGQLTEREIAERGFMQILDAETYREKRQLMVGMKPYLDKRLLHNIAAALDIVLEEGDLDSQYDSLLHCLDTMKRFEGGRLR